MLTGGRADLSLGPLAHIIGGQEDKKNASNAAIQNELCTFSCIVVHFQNLPFTEVSLTIKLVEVDNRQREEGDDDDNKIDDGVHFEINREP